MTAALVGFAAGIAARDLAAVGQVVFEPERIAIAVRRPARPIASLDVASAAGHQHEMRLHRVVPRSVVAEDFTEPLCLRLQLPVGPIQVGFGFNQDQMGQGALGISSIEGDQQVDVFLVAVDVSGSRVLEGLSECDVGVCSEVERHLYPVEMVVHGNERMSRQWNADRGAETLSETPAKFGSGSVECECFPEDGETFLPVQGTQTVNYSEHNELLQSERVPRQGQSESGRVRVSR